MGQDFDISEAVRVRESLLTTSVKSSNIDFHYPLKKLPRKFCPYNQFSFFLFWIAVYTIDAMKAFSRSLGQYPLEQRIFSSRVQLRLGYVHIHVPYARHRERVAGFGLQHKYTILHKSSSPSHEWNKHITFLQSFYVQDGPRKVARLPFAFAFDYCINFCIYAMLQTRATFSWPTLYMANEWVPCKKTCPSTILNYH
jgi:hypothetical protein